ncbi:MAG: hypothetical protein K2Q32_03455 [Alphaproteobacteria bacterium]|nr:hypothetical protein [Alphaproteobacteria bacterium]
MLKLFSVVALFAILAIHTSSARAELYCDPQIKARSEQNRQNSILKDIARFEGAYGQPNSFDSLFCGAQITSGFDKIGQNLVGGLTNQIDGLISQLFQQACKAAIQPIQQLAAQTCIPNIQKNYFDLSSLNSLFNTQSKNNCPGGTQLIQVTPIIGGSSFSGGSNYNNPELYW